MFEGWLDREIEERFEEYRKERLLKECTICSDLYHGYKAGYYDSQKLADEQIANIARAKLYSRRKLEKDNAILLEFARRALKISEGGSITYLSDNEEDYQRETFDLLDEIDEIDR